MKPQFFDVHTHVHFETFAEDAGAVMERALSAGIWSIQVGTQRDTSRAAISFAEKYATGVYAAVGLHPCHTERSYHDKNETADEYHGEIFDEAQYRELAKHPKVVAIGECGLDYYRLSSDTREKQIDAFRSQIELARELKKPLMLHIRPSPSSEDAYRDALGMLKDPAHISGNVHFFVGSPETARAFFDLGFTVSFTGVITFTRDYDEIIRMAPLDMIMSETDAPYVAPHPHRGKRNEPLFVSEVVRRIADIKNLDIELVKEVLVENALRVFSIVA